MIFDNKLVLHLLNEYNSTNNQDVLVELLDACNPLMEAVVSKYNKDYRDDMLQECRIKALRAFQTFDPTRTKAYSYFSIVFNNVCITWMSKVGSPHYELQDHIKAPVSTMQEIITDVYDRNVERFPSMRLKYIYKATRVICIGLGCGSSVKEIIDAVDLLFNDKNMSTAFVQSTLIYMRLKHENNVGKIHTDTDEYSILTDLKEIVGDELYEWLIILFSGMSIKIP